MTQVLIRKDIKEELCWGAIGDAVPGVSPVPDQAATRGLGRQLGEHGPRVTAFSSAMGIMIPRCIAWPSNVWS